MARQSSVEAGAVYGRWTVKGPTKDRHTPSRRYWDCVCLCGTERAVLSHGLVSGASQSCGCLNREISRITSKTSNRSHGRTKTKEHIAWTAMKQRCYYTKHRSYAYYGGRGIVVCERWLNSFENFFEDMGLRPSDEHSLDRIDSDGDYSPDNCKWSTREEQSTNRRNVRFFTKNGETHSMAEWERRLGLTKGLLHQRVARSTPKKRMLEMCLRPGNRCWILKKRGR